ncbi:MAG: LPS-assembly protein LptD [Lentisphaerales bacterium]|nr:MAG: LPS-assembly protein LptD [Lentisphaerales bacterium]
MKVLTAMCALLLAAVCVAAGATNAPPDMSATNASPDMKVSADVLEYARGISLVRASGNVVVEREMDKLTADRVTFEVATTNLWASGNVTYMRQGSIFRGETIYANLATGHVVGEGESEYRQDPFRVIVKGGIERVSENEVVAYDAVATSCGMDPDHYHYNIMARKITVDPGVQLSAKDVWFYLGGVRVFYAPFLRQSAEGYGWTLTPGYSSRLGTYLLTAYAYRISDALDGRTHLDYYSLRGLGIGHDLLWHGPDRKWGGDFSLYYIADKAPMDGDDMFAGRTVDSTRYTARFSHYQYFGKNTHLLSRLTYLSDTDVLEDFFSSEYRLGPQPENYVSLVYRQDDYIAGISARTRLNGFYETVTRLPEAWFEVPMRRVQEGPLYYAQRTSVGQLEKLRAAGSEAGDYAALRIDSEHQLSMGRKVWFLNVVPGIGYRGTYYSDSPVIFDGEGGVESGGDDVLRSLYALSTDVSFKMFRIWQTEGEGDAGYRHVVEPYAKYVLVPEPNVNPSTLHKFDKIDDLGERHDVRVGMRNKFQTKRRNRPFDLLDIDTWISGDFNRAKGQPVFDALEMDSELRPLRNVDIDIDGRIEIADPELSRLNTRIVVGNRRSTFAALEYRFKRDESKLLASELTYRPNNRWTHTYSARYELQESRLEEQSYWIRRDYDCMYVAAGVNQIPEYKRTDGTERGDEYQFLVRFDIKAFPDVGVTLQ